MLLKRLSAAAFLTFALCVCAGAQEKQTENTLKLAIGGKDGSVREEVFKYKRIEKR